jgi:membrane protease YdiL (CAAX protease family)
LYPEKLKYPFVEISGKEFTQNIGFHITDNKSKNVLLGILLGVFSSMGMLIGSILTGRYVFDWSNLQLEQVLFSLVPGIWEEVFFRGIMMMVLINHLKDVKKAAIYQSLIFAALHFYGYQLWDLIDLLSIFFMGLTFTYLCHKTNSLVPAMIFHFIHDAFIFLFQVPDGVYNGNFENGVFFISLWGMLLVGCLITYIFTEKWNYKQTPLLYDVKKFE